MAAKYTSLKLTSSKSRDFTGYTYDLIISFTRSLYGKPSVTHTKPIVTNAAFNKSGSSVIHKVESGIIIKSLKYFVKYGGKNFKSINGNTSEIKSVAITKYPLKTTLGLTKNNFTNTQVVEIKKYKVILGIHSNTSPDAGFLDGHAWISYTNSNSKNIVTYGLWPDTHPDIPNNGSKTDVRIGMEKSSGQYNRYYQLTPNQIKRWKEYSNKKAEWKYTRTCASWASNAIYYVVNEDVDADDLFGFETPRELSIHIIELEKKNNTSLLYPYISNQDNSRSF
ncbi:hypothetical protein [Psychrobacter okhotskensis]|uniref:hypothetical protein n=1 Tax=Psychrobacter okhotskensis TaxID=212403 RepID=UPI00191A2D2A|nr:hypothetical protein [Psychrobacter okhotskensis]